MELSCQTTSIQFLETLASRKCQSVLIEGVKGCGKTYLAAHYAKLLNISDFQVVNPTVQDIRQAVDYFSVASNPSVLCIENLDTGVAGAAYTLLKFLEEPQQNVFIVVTCSNINNIPDTIISRSIVLYALPPNDDDLRLYAMNHDPIRYKAVKSHMLWRCVRTFSDVRSVLDMTRDDLSYFDKIRDMCTFKSPVTTIAWNLSHYPDNRETPIELVIRYVMEVKSSDAYVQQCGIDAIRDISSCRISSNAVLSKFIFECKYGG